MLQEECKEKILSEEYRDFMMRDTGALGKTFLWKTDAGYR